MQSVSPNATPANEGKLICWSGGPDPDAGGEGRAVCARVAPMGPMSFPSPANLTLFVLHTYATEEHSSPVR